jgi:heme-degrading monooxygenase HmoA
LPATKNPLEGWEAGTLGGINRFGLKAFRPPSLLASSLPSVQAEVIEMIVVSNRIQVAPGHEEAFEKRFEGRARLVENHPGFIRLEILRPKSVQMHGKPLGGSEYYVVLTYWESEPAFVRWTESEDFRTAHASRPPREMFSGPNVFEMHEVIQTATRKS